MHHKCQCMCKGQVHRPITARLWLHIFVAVLHLSYWEEATHALLLITLGRATVPSNQAMPCCVTQLQMFTCTLSSCMAPEAFCAPCPAPHTSCPHTLPCRVLTPQCPLPLAPGGLIRGVVRRERQGWGLTGRLQRCVLYQCVPLSTGCSLLPGKFLLAAEQQHSHGLRKSSWALYMNRSCQGPPVAHLTSNAIGASYVLTAAAAGSRGSGGRVFTTRESRSRSSSCSMSSSGDGRSSNNSGGSSSWSGTGSSTLLRTCSLLHTSNSSSSGLDMFDAAGDVSCCSHGRSFKAGCRPRLRPWLQRVVQDIWWPASSSLTPAAAADTSAETAAGAGAAATPAAVAPCKQGAGRPQCLGFQDGAAAAGAGTSAARCTDAEVLLTLQYKLHFRCAVLPRRYVFMQVWQGSELKGCSCAHGYAGYMQAQEVCMQLAKVPLYLLPFLGLLAVVADLQAAAYAKQHRQCTAVCRYIQPCRAPLCCAGYASL